MFHKQTKNKLVLRMNASLMTFHAFKALHIRNLKIALEMKHTVNSIILLFPKVFFLSKMCLKNYVFLEKNLVSTIRTGKLI